LHPGSKYIMKRDGNKVKLVVRDIHEADGGEITCEIANSKGRDTSTAKLSIQGNIHLFTSYKSVSQSKAKFL
jgi:hypothetical protein